MYVLEDELRILIGVEVLEYDALFKTPPAALDEYARSCLQEAIAAGAHVAWFGFEGSFHFEELLTADIANQIYGVADSEGIQLATLDADLASPAWKQRVVEARSRLVSAWGAV
jgi:hypothetical protein